MFLDNFDQIVSLGYICNVTSLKSQLKTHQPAGQKLNKMIFDHVGVPMWAVKELIQNDFTDFALEQNLKQKKLFEQDDKEYWVDEKYYTRFLFVSNPSSLAQKLQKSIDNLKNTLNGQQKLLLVRYQEPTNYEDRGNRIEFPEYVTKYQKTELEHLKELSQSLSSKYPNLDFKILFMNFDDTFHDDKIIAIKVPMLDYRYKKVGAKMENAIKSHQDFLDSL